MEKNYQLKTRQVCLFFIAFTPVIRLFMLPSLISGIANEDMWLSAVINAAIDLITITALSIACRFAESDFYETVRKNFGETLAKILFTLYAAFFLVKAVLPIAEQKDYVELTLYNTFPNLLTFTPLFFICFYLALKHLRVIGRASDVMWIFTLIGYGILFGLSVSNADFGALLPVGARGLNAIAKASKSALNWYGDGVYLLFFMGNFKAEKKDGIKIVLFYIFSALLTVLFTAVFYAIFKSIAYRQRFALTEVSKYSTVINNLGRFDYIGIFFILTSSFFSLSLPVYFCCYCLNKAFPLKLKFIYPLAISVLLFSFINFFGEYFYALENFIISGMPAAFIVFGNVIPIIVSAAVIFRSKRRYETD